jgi:hypothetical protein
MGFGLSASKAPRTPTKHQRKPTLGSRLPSLQPLSFSLSASSSQTHRPNIHGASPPAMPRALGASAETMEVGICQGCLRALPWAVRPGSGLAALFGSPRRKCLSCCPSFSLAVHPIFCSCEALLHPLTLVGLRLPPAMPLTATGCATVKTITG